MAGYIGSKAVSVNTTSATITDDLTIGDDLTVTDDMTVGGTLGVTGVLTATSLDISGDIDVDGTTNLDVVDIDGAVDMASTLAVAGVVTANAGVVVDNFTLDGTTLALSSGNFTLDVAGDIIFDGDGADILFKDGGTEWLGFNSGGTMAAAGAFTLDVNGDIVLDSNNGVIDLKSAGNTFAKLDDESGHLAIIATQTNGDIIFKGNDDGSAATTLLTLDSSAAGAATFTSSVITGGEVSVAPSSGTAKVRLTSQGSGSEVFTVCGQIPGVSNTGFAIRNETDSRNDIQIRNNGEVTIANGLTLTDGNLIVANGHGINFSAQTSANSVTGVSTTSELLDHYEEGTWTPVVVLETDGSSISGSTTSGSYTRIGNAVTLTFSVGIGTVGSTANFNKVSGVPFTAANNSKQAVGAVRENSNTGNMYHIRATTGDTNFLIRRYDNHQALASGMVFIGAITYFV